MIYCSTKYSCRLLLYRGIFLQLAIWSPRPPLIPPSKNSMNPPSSYRLRNDHLQRSVIVCGALPLTAAAYCHCDVCLTGSPESPGNYRHDSLTHRFLLPSSFCCCSRGTYSITNSVRQVTLPMPSHFKVQPRKDSLKHRT